MGDPLLLGTHHSEYTSDCRRQALMADERGLAAGDGYVAYTGVAEAEKPICAALMQKCCENLMEVLCLLLTKNGLDTMNSQLLGVCCMAVRSLVSLLLHLEAVERSQQ